MSSPNSENSRTWQEVPADGAAVSRGLHLMRHGESVWNVAGRLQGQAHTPQLTRRGMIQVQASAQQFARQLADVARTPGDRHQVKIIASDQMRARQSANIVATQLQQNQHHLIHQEHPFHAGGTSRPGSAEHQHGAGVTTVDVAVALDKRLREQCVGRMQGKLTADLSAEPCPDGVDVADVRWGGGESLADVAKRLRGLVDEISADYAERPDHSTTILVSHGITLGVLAALLDGGSHYDVCWQTWANAAIRTWAYTLLS